MTEGSQPLTPTLQPHEEGIPCPKTERGRVQTGLSLAFPGNREWREGVYLGARTHVQGFGPTRPSCPDGFRPPSHSSFIPGPLLEGMSPLFLPQAEPGCGQTPPTCHFLGTLVGLGAGHTARVLPSCFPHSLFSALAEEPVVGRGGSLIHHDRHASWGAPLDSTPSKMRDGMAQWLEFACCL